MAPRSLALTLIAFLVGLNARAAEDQGPHKVLSRPDLPFDYWVDGRDPAPFGLSLATVQSRTEAAWQTWDDVSCAALTFRANGLTQFSNPQDPYDDRSVSAVWLSQEDPFYYLVLGAGSAAAGSMVLSYAGVVQRCDIYLNGVRYPWSVSDTPAATQVDVQSLVTHEVGHCIGLGHLTKNPEAVMYPFSAPGALRRVLSPADTNAVCTQYPITGHVGSPCLADGGCGNASLKCLSPPLPDGGSGPPVCSGGCSIGPADACPLPYVCQPSAEFANQFTGACFPPEAYVTQVGAPCTASRQCGSAVAECQQEFVLPSGSPAWAAGYCTQDCGNSGAACPAATSCVELGEGDTRCLKSCRLGSADCRPGYTCAPTTDGRSAVCVPSCTTDDDCGGGSTCRICDGMCLPLQNPTGQIGQPCSRVGDCGPGQLCADVTGTGFSVCTQPCALPSCSACPGGASCHPVGLRGELFCLKDCAAGTCGPGMQCGTLPTGRGCLPACQSDEQCPLSTFCVSGECRGPGDDAGSCELCPPGDAGTWVDPSGTDGGPPSHPAGGCGCTGSPGPSVVWLLLPVVLGLRRGTFPRLLQRSALPSRQATPWIHKMSREPLQGAATPFRWKR